MIKLSRTAAPPTLTVEVVADLTARYKADGSAVWRRDDIVGALLEMSNKKCAYCEAKIDEESKYLEVEHFYCKDAHPDRVVDWINLLPACKRCNAQKGSHDVVADGMIVNPCDDDPRDYFTLMFYRLWAKNDNEKAQITLETVWLNDSDRVVSKRFAIGEKLHEQLANLYARAVDFAVGSSRAQARLNRIRNTARNILLECGRNSPFAASAASTVVASPVYNALKQRMQVIGAWTEELERLDSDMREIALL